MAAVECAGVAFALKTTNNTLSKLPALQTEVTLYTYFLVQGQARYRTVWLFTIRES
ncbi:MAG: OB-fold domain-containing protein [Oscillospiraceae bacterium]